MPRCLPLRSVVSPVLLLCIVSLWLGGCGKDSNPAAPPAPVKHLYFVQDGNANGLFEINMTTGAATLVGAGKSGTTSSTDGLTETTDPNMLLGSRWDELIQIRTDGDSAAVMPGTIGVEGLAMNLTTGLLYGSINGAFHAISPTTGLSTATLTAPGADVEGLAADPVNNRVFGIARDSQSLYVFSVTGNSWSTVGSTGRDWTDPGLAYDDRAGVLYGVNSNTDSLFRINPATGATTVVGALGTNGAGGLAFVVK